MRNLKDIIKATLFVSGEGVDIDVIAEKLDVKTNEVLKAIDALRDEITEADGIQIIEYKNKVQLTSNPSYADYISTILNPIREKALTKAALETLAIIAYKQPITRLDVEDIRKVGCEYAISMLEDNKMIEVVGRKDAVGKPLLYGTTEEFLKRFGLTDINHLPDYNELMDRIAIIRQEEKPKTDGLYFDYKIDGLEEEDVTQNIVDQLHEDMPVEEMEKAVDDLVEQVLLETRNPNHNAS